MKTQIGKIRFVNPERPPSYVAEIIESDETLSARTKDFQHFAFYVVHRGLEFYCGREFSSHELMQFAHKEFTYPNQMRRDDFGDIPATGWDDPRRWQWCAFGGGESRLEREHRPTSEQLAQLSQLALNGLEPGKRYPPLDEWECWVCDKETLEPLALVMTAPDRESIETLFYSPMIRLGRGDLSFDFEDCVAARDLQKRINERVNTATEPHRFGYYARIFRRDFDDSAIEFCPDGTQREHPPGYLPSGTLAAPYESERAALRPVQSYEPQDEWLDEI